MLAPNEHEGITFGGNGNGSYLDCGSGYKTIRVCQTSWACNTIKGEFYYI